MSLTFESNIEKNQANPKYIGPGTWNVIHTLAYNANTIAEKQSFVNHMKIICRQFPCDTCRGHCKEYIKQNPMEEYFDVITEGRELGLFTWTWQFHNAVNHRIGKPLMSWDMAYHLYSQLGDKEMCSKDCSGPAKEKKPLVKPTRDIPPIPVKTDKKQDKRDKNVKDKHDKTKKPLYQIEKESRMMVPRYYKEHQDDTMLEKLKEDKYKRVRNYNELK